MVYLAISLAFYSVLKCINWTTGDTESGYFYNFLKGSDKFMQLFSYGETEDPFSHCMVGMCVPGERDIPSQSGLCLDLHNISAL